jgi:glycosyltransferase involved in cell wall biosynthesis
MHDLLAGSAGLLYPSLYEGFGFPPLEALALGCRAVCADLAPIRDSCADRPVRPGEDDEQLRLVAPDDLAGWTRAIEELAHPGSATPERWAGRRFRDVARDTVAAYRVALARFRAVG